MILPFSQYFDKEKQKPTYFAEKIWVSLQEKQNEMHIEQTEKFGNPCIDYVDLWTKFDVGVNKYFQIGIYTDAIPKIHTIRTDAKNRWKAGNKVHCVYNNRSKKQFQFAPTFMCKSVQNIEITYIDHPELDADIVVRVDGRKLEYAEIEQLAINDGFNSGDDFFNWFNENYKGKIIHFTNFKY